MAIGSPYKVQKPGMEAWDENFQAFAFDMPSF